MNGHPAGWTELPVVLTAFQELMLFMSDAGIPPGAIVAALGECAAAAIAALDPDVRDHVYAEYLQTLDASYQTQRARADEIRWQLLRDRATRGPDS
jgi:hypothetical protein